MTESFGARMARLKAERGTGTAPGPGRPTIASKYTKQIAAANTCSAAAMADEAQRYIAELAPKEPETCPSHHRVLACPVQGCEVESERTAYDHAAARYLFDRIMGRPTSRSENALSVKFVTELTARFAEAFLAVNDLPAAEQRRGRGNEPVGPCWEGSPAEMPDNNGTEERFSAEVAARGEPTGWGDVSWRPGASSDAFEDDDVAVAAAVCP